MDREKREGDKIERNHHKLTGTRVHPGALARTLHKKLVAILVA